MGLMTHDRKGVIGLGSNLYIHDLPISVRSDGCVERFKLNNLFAIYCQIEISHISSRMI